MPPRIAVGSAAYGGMRAHVRAMVWGSVATDKASEIPHCFCWLTRRSMSGRLLRSSRPASLPERKQQIEKSHVRERASFDALLALHESVASARSKYDISIKLLQSKMSILGTYGVVLRRFGFSGFVVFQPEGGRVIHRMTSF
ncbi:hypothetical protein [Burkholderia sp. ABCPW 14]|uniref:hypothetical protein n=1 Tax=Burkholderia sp. ABCPW 14 TaxID=1637860 RepID=UPI0012E34D27|nr:hypothetical protein [Burkholderia sp. ABCPW 14]